MKRSLRMMMTAAMQGAAAPAWTPDSPTTDGEVLAHTYFDLETGLFQDSAETTPVAADDDPVGSEVNQGSDSYSIVQATAGNKPLYKTNILNGKPVLQHISNDRLSGTFSGALSQPYTIFVVAKLDEGAEADIFKHALLNGLDITNYLDVSKASDLKWLVSANAPGITYSFSDSNWNIWTILINGASSQFWLNGVPKATGNAGTAAPAGLFVGTRYQGDLGWLGYIGKRLIYPGNLSDADKNQVGQYLADFYALSYTEIG